MLKYLLYALALISPIHLIAQTASGGSTFTPMNEVPPIITECADSAFDCTTKRIQAFVDKRLYYPREDYPKKIKGQAVLQFTIDERGQMGSISCLVAPTPAMAKRAEAVARQIKTHFDWTPGLRKGKAVDVIFYLPLRFDSDRRTLAPPPPPPPPPAPEEEEIFKVVAEMPRFPGCEDLPKAERKACADRKLRDFIYEHMVYPEQARDAQVSVRVVIQFIIERDGSVSSIEALNAPGYGLAEAAVEAASLMQKGNVRWIPGSSHNRLFRVQYILPISFDFKDQDSSTTGPE